MNTVFIIEKTSLAGGFLLVNYLIRIRVTLLPSTT